jgi:hypothetical protein
MSLVENLINQISTSGLSGITKPTGFDLDDDTFSKLLDKQLASSQNIVQNNFIGNMGMPAGFNIEPLEGTEFAEAVQDQFEILGDKLSREEYINQPIEFKEINQDDYFSTLLKSRTGTNSDFLNFAKRNATMAYNVFSKNFVVDMNDFVDDLTNIS